LASRNEFARTLEGATNALTWTSESDKARMAENFIVSIKEYLSKWKLCYCTSTGML
jgi:hypothetical protein